MTTEKFNKLSIIEKIEFFLNKITYTLEDDNYIMLTEIKGYLNQLKTQKRGEK